MLESFSTSLSVHETTMAASQAHYIKLARSLPPRLLRFFTRYPPPSILKPSTYSVATAAPALAPASGAAVSGAISPAPTTAADQETATTTAPMVEEGENEYLNPFQPQRHPATGRLQDPVFSLRRQAELYKLARAHGVEELLPPSSKAPAERLARRVEFGLRVRGTGVGQRVKGHWWERTLHARLEERRKAMMGMPQLIQRWKKLGHGKRWKNFPK